MLMLLFYLNKERYALHSKQVIEIVPLVDLKKQPHTPDYVSGIFNYRGQIVPVIDLCQLIQGNPCQTHLSTRIILVNGRSGYLSHEKTLGSPYVKESNQSPMPHNQHLLGLMAERVVETMNVSESDLVDTNIRVETAPYLGKMILNEQGMIQCISIDNLLTEKQRSSLWATYDTTSS